MHRLVAVGLVLLVALVAVGTAMPTAFAALQGLARCAWPFTGFLVAQGVGMAGGGDLGDRSGLRAALVGVVVLLPGCGRG